MPMECTELNRIAGPWLGLQLSGRELAEYTGGPEVSKEAKKLGSRKTKTQTGLPKEFLAKASLGNITSFR